ncbi:MAG: hypothetical protein GKR86_07910 [Ilumatobacter sp.]|nr:hypothetical protein [Ilumatobacter sp.]
MVMRTVNARIRIGAFVAAVSAMFFVGVLPTGASVEAHGSSTNPPSRYYTCRFLEPENPNCAAAWSSNSQALYDWNEVNIGDVNGQHRARIPDGQLCSAGRSKYAAFDVANSEWPATDVSSGPFTMTYTATAPHATAYFKLYLTNFDYNPNQPLAWDDLSLVYDSGSIARQSSYAFNMNLPERSGRHILYLVWQRSDSPEAFYACNDVNFGGTQTPPTTVPPTTAPPTTAPPTTVPPTTVPPTTTPPTTTSGVSAWSSYATYVAGDVVSYDGVLYEAKWWTRSFAPDTPVINPWDTPWKELSTMPPTTMPPTTMPPTTAPPTTAQPTTAPPTTTSGVSAWSSYETYVAGDVVSYDGVVYEAKWWTRSFVPDTPVINPWDTPWKELSTMPPATTMPAINAWSSYATYVAGDVVSYDGVVYEAKWWTRSFVPDTSVINSWDTPWKELSF